MSGAGVHVGHHAEAESPTWTLENEFLALRLVRDELNMTVSDKESGKQWQMEPERRGFLIQRYGLQLHKPLSEVPLVEWREVREGDLRGIELRSICPDPWIQYNLRFRFMLASGRPELLIQVAPHEDPGHTPERWVREVYYPRSFQHSSSGQARTVLPFQQGTLLPGDWPEELTGETARRLFDPWSWESGTGPWWGHIDPDGAGYVAIIETPDDALFDLHHPAGGPTSVAPRWVPSFEAFRYPRRIRYRFFPQADHVTVALAYRDYCQQVGRWRSIEEKRLEKPRLDKLCGAIGLRKMALLTDLRGDGVKRRFRSFDQIAAELDELALEYPNENIYFTLAGWQTLGYDHAHPAACPPSPEAGSWEGMRRISDVANRHDMLFGVHEQYRDFFLSSPFWSEERTRKDSRRDSPRHAYWAGATQSVLCPRLMLDFVKMNVEQLRDQAIRLNASYQDVLTAIPLEECYDHRHPATRTECREARYSIFEYYRDLGWVVASESASDWAAPIVDYFNVHWARREPGRDGEPVGIPVPLFSLVFHDCAMLVSKGTPALHCALAGMNSLRAEDRVLRHLHEEVAYMPLTAHRLLSEDGRRQESVFGDRVTVEADLAKGSYRISGLTDQAELSGTLEEGTM
ncbi:MAG: DUF5696 domain-containing protein [Candidatus Brocadiaceae bacterium]|jgi:hypothetical protein